MSLRDLGKNDISEETQALKDKLASRETENAGLRTQLMRREAELEELTASFNETVFKLNREAERALQLESEASSRSADLKTERMALRNAELALQSVQEKFKTEERAKKELESTLDTLSLHSQTTTTEHQAIQREKRALESRVRELERIVQNHEAKATSSNIPRRGGRPRSSSVASFRSSAVEQELSETKAQLATKEKNLHALEQKLAHAQADQVKAENARISTEKAGQKRIAELLSTLERKEEEIEAFKAIDNGGEREEELLKRIDEDAAKIAALEKLAAESHATRATQATVHKLQNQLKTESEKLRRSEEHRNNLVCEKEELVRQCEVSQGEIAQMGERLRVSELEIRRLEASHLELQAELNTRSMQGSRHELSSSDAMTVDDPDHTALANHIQTLLQAVDRLRNERDELKRALEFSEVEYRITSQGSQARIASLTAQLAERAREAELPTVPTHLHPLEARMQRLASCATAFTVVISNLQSHLELSEANLSAVSTDLVSSNSRLCDALALVGDQTQLLAANEQERNDLLHKLETISKESSQSDEERSQSPSEVVDLQGQVYSLAADINASEAARQEAHERLRLAEERFTTLNKSYQDLESERNSLALQITNLQDDLDRAQDELADTQDRYSVLQAQQLSDMSTSEAVKTLKSRIEDLETRALHRTQEISDYQHDIRRLETNIKLQEDRIAELTSELELLASQKDAMVEDCAEARAARDEAIQKLEAAEDEAETLEEQLRQAQQESETTLDSASRLAELEAANSELIRELDALRHDRERLNDHLEATAHHSQSLEVESSKQKVELREVVVSLAVIHQACNYSSRHLQQSYQHAASLKSRLLLLEQDLERMDARIHDADEEKRRLRRQLADVSTESELSSSTAAEHHQTQVDELQQQLATRDQERRLLDEQLSSLIPQLRDVDSLRSLLQTKEEELSAVKQQLEESQARHTEVEMELQGRITALSTELEERVEAENILGRPDEETAHLLEELEDIRAKLQVKQDSFAALENRHQDDVQEFAAARQDLKNRLAETEQRLHALHTDHVSKLLGLESEYKQEADLLASNLEDREQEVDELRQQLQQISEAHACAQGELREELSSYEVRHAAASDLEKELRQTIADTQERLAEAEALREERQTLQTQITSLEAEIQRSVSLTRYLESQVRESEETCQALKERLQQSQLSLGESEKAGKAAEFNLTLQATQHEKVVSALRREIASLQSGPELRSALADLEDRNGEMDDLLRAKTQEIEEYDDRILETLKANKKLTSKVESLARKVQALQAKLASMKNQPQEQPESALPPKRASSSTPISPIQPVPPAPTLAVMNSGESSRPSPASRSKTPEPQPQPIFTLPSDTPGRTSEPSGLEMSASRKRPAPDDDEREGVPPEGYYPADVALRSGPTPRLRRAHGHPAGFTPVRGASLRKTGQSPGHRAKSAVTPSEIITDVTNNPRGSAHPVDSQGKKRSWLGKIKGGPSSQQMGARSGVFGGQ